MVHARNLSRGIYHNSLRKIYKCTTIYPVRDCPLRLFPFLVSHGRCVVEVRVYLALFRFSLRNEFLVCLSLLQVETKSQLLNERRAGRQRVYQSIFRRTVIPQRAFEERCLRPLKRFDVRESQVSPYDL